jgi:hypothetical protein
MCWNIGSVVLHPRRALAMPQWQYSTVNLDDPNDSRCDLLNKLGADGWELVVIAPNNIAYLKRQITDPRRAP